MSTQLGLNYSLYRTIAGDTTATNLILARVDRVIYGPVKSDGSRDEAFYANNQWNSVGGILYTVMYGNENVPAQAGTVAKPYDANITHYPVVGEIVELAIGPSTKLNDDSLAKDLYYRTPINLWNNVHQNAFPNFFNLAGFNNNLQVPYTDTTKGIAKSSVTSSQVISLGSTFKEQSGIKNLQGFEGDIIYQGRWGQSIRFGSTVTDSAIKNPWSSAGQNGLPITIIRNGQSTRFIGPTDPWTPTIEDINTDAASIYLCAGQVIRISDIEKNHIPNMKSFTTKSKPQENQIQRPIQQPVSTDSTSARQQSQAELQAAQASANNVSNQATRSNK
jgi:hypothetical protein